MTKQELIKMAGSEDQAEYAMLILLKNVKPEFVKMCIYAELQEAEAQIKEYEKSGHIVYINQHYSVNWCKPDEPFKDREAGWGFRLTPEEKAQHEAGEAECRKADRLLQAYNRLNTWLYHN